MAKGKYEKWLTEEGLIRIRGWAMDGLTDEQIAQNMGVSYSTLRVWRDKYSALSAALKETKEIADRNVENALYEAAMKGNITAQIFWLKNRKPKMWREKQQDDSVDNHITISIEGGDYGD